jgi:hypothetical protein
MCLCIAFEDIVICMLRIAWVAIIGTVDKRRRTGLWMLVNRKADVIQTFRHTTMYGNFIVTGSRLTVCREAVVSMATSRALATARLHVQVNNVAGLVVHAVRLHACRLPCFQCRVPIR